ncbi:uncharacterized protein VNE69_04206 [Vairimorpha necatrix]|uniref:Uncharacterized protein n=1 Tax=Vairimorpha necatrix TaxID=6039 RepID=A0AAX4JBS3_9MICR
MSKGFIDILIILYLKISLQSLIAPWPIGFAENDRGCKNEIIEYMKLKLLDFECTCHDPNFFNDNIIILIISDNLENLICRQISKTKISYLSKINTKTFYKDLIKLMSYYNPQTKKYLNYCNIYNNNLKEQKSILKEELEKIFKKIKVYHGDCIIKNTEDSYIIKLIPTKVCKCSKDQIIGNINNIIYKRLRSKSLVQSLNPSEIFIKKNQINLFNIFNLNFGKEKFFFNFLKQLLNTEKFKTYFIFFLSTSNYKDCYEMPISIPEMCDKIMYYEYNELSRKDLSLLKLFCSFAFHEIYFAMYDIRNGKYKKLIEDISIEKDLEELIMKIEKRIKKKLKKHKNLIELIWDYENYQEKCETEEKIINDPLFKEYLKDIFKIQTAIKHLISCVYEITY